jgi:2-amino-4-hydroxy-6-hydroxymethyldihydropteridine diphosphokinase
MSGQLPLASAIIAIGSNLGDSPSAVTEAIERLAKFSEQPLFKSSLWETAPVDCPPGSAKFVNAIVALIPKAYETPETLLAKLHEIEAEFGRQRGHSINAPRLLDLDLIAFAEDRRNSPRLILPHPRAHRRRFVLAPLCELDPGYRFPGHSKTAAELLASLPDDSAQFCNRFGSPSQI